jgi:drug/metabolite transporter (DMT)-like permease
MSATSVTADSGQRELLGLALGLIGVIAFSLTLPMTRTAVRELDPWFVAFGRMSIAGLIALAVLLATRGPRPGRAELGGALALAEPEAPAVPRPRTGRQS